MKKLSKSMAIAGLVFVSAAAGWTLSRYEQYMEGQAAVGLASTFLQSRSLNLQAFGGPAVEERPHTERMFIWYSKEIRPALEVHVSPSGDLMCLYEVMEPKRFHELECRVPK